MPKYWLISDRNNGGTGTGRNVAGLTYFTSEGTGPLNNIASWQKTTPTQFRTLLAAAADAFPALAPGDNENQSHVTILVHGFNVSFSSATDFYQNLCGKLFDGSDSLGLCILYDWPSLGSVAGYEPDRAHARDCAGDPTDILTELFDWLIQKQQDAIASDGDPQKSCKAKVSLIAHSMGNYVLQKAMAAGGRGKRGFIHPNGPVLVELSSTATRMSTSFALGKPDRSRSLDQMPSKTLRLILAVLIALVSTGCACGRYGTLAARRTITSTAEVIDVYGVGSLLRPRGVDGGFTFGWRHATYIYPRLPADGAKEGVRWTFGWVPLRRGEPFFLAARSVGGEVTKYPSVLQAHLGFRTDAFTFAARAEESRVVNFTYRAGEPGKTILAMDSWPTLALR